MEDVDDRVDDLRTALGCVPFSAQSRSQEAVAVDLDVGDREGAEPLARYQSAVARSRR
jgi:hypothetical protein